MPRVVVSDMMTCCRAFPRRALFPVLLCIVAWVPAPHGSVQPAPGVSAISGPIRTSLSSIVPEIEARVEKSFSGKARERGIDVEYDVARDPIRLNMVGAGLH